MKLSVNSLKKLLALLLISVSLTFSQANCVNKVNKPNANANITPSSPEVSTRRQIILNFDRAASAVEDLITLKSALKKDKLISARTELAITDILLKINAIILIEGTYVDTNPNFSISSSSEIAQIIGSFGNVVKELTNKEVFGQISPTTQQKIDAIVGVLVLVSSSLSSLLK